MGGGLVGQNDGIAIARALCKIDQAYGSLKLKGY
jgi:ribosomal protein S9